MPEAELHTSSPVLAPLRSRAEQLADELVDQHLDAQPTTRQLPAYSPPVRPVAPGR